MSETVSRQPVERRHPRHTVTAFVDYTGANHITYQRVQNISLGGICISTPMPEEIGVEVDLVVQFPDLDAAFCARGKVVWVNDEDPCDMGVRFVDIDASRERRLQGIIERLPKT